MNTAYETDRLVLKMLNKSHAGLVLDYYIRNKDFLKEWEPVKGSEFYTNEYQEEQLENEVTNIESGNSLRLWIFKKGEEDKVIGCVGFSNIIKGAFHSCHLGYKADKDEINQGYLTEAIKKGIDIIFNDYRLHRIEANVMPKNNPSLRVVKKLGFYHEGLAYKYLKINGKWEDHIHMVLLNEEIE